MTLLTEDLAAELELKPVAFQHETYVDVGPAHGPPQGNQVWHRWEARYMPGTYELTAIFLEASWVSFFAIGRVTEPYQPAALTFEQRFPVANSPARALTGRGGISSMTFSIGAGDIIRIEGWTHRPGDANPNLPHGFQAPSPEPPHDSPPPVDHWPPHWGAHGEPLMAHPAGDWWPSVSRRSFDGDVIKFALEDGGMHGFEDTSHGSDYDFNDLVVSLRRLN